MGKTFLPWVRSCLWFCRFTAWLWGLVESPEYSGTSCAAEVGKVYTCLGLDHCQKAV